MATNGKTSKSPKTKSSKPAIAKAVKPAKAKAGVVKATVVKAGARGKAKPAASENFYINVDRLAVQVRSGKPGPGDAAETFTTFAAARERAMERLIDVIDDAERRLHALRHAVGCDDI